MSAHRYWRIYCTEGQSTAHFDIKEIELRTSIGGADVTGSGTASASSESGGYEASKAFDNDAGTTWYTPASNLPAWIKYDFGSGNDQDIVEFALTPWSNTEMATRFKLQWSDDDSAWTTLYDVHHTEWFNGLVAFSANNNPEQSGNGTYWRVKATAVDGSSVFGLSELEMFTGAVSLNRCTGGAGFGSTQEEIGGPPSDAFDTIKADSGVGSYWSALRVTDQWIGYRFASAETITIIGITARHTYQNQSPKDFTLQYWDGSAYQTAFTITGQTGWTSGETRYFNSSGLTSAPTAPSAGARPVVFICT